MIGRVTRRPRGPSVVRRLRMRCIRSRKSRIACAALVLLAATATSVRAQGDYPAKPVRIVVPTAAGAGLDTLARLVAQKLSARAGKQFVIDNRAGAGGAIGMELAAHAAPDGYTLAMFTL